MRILLIGCGAIGSEVALGLEAVDAVTDVYLLDARADAAGALAARLHKARAAGSFREALGKADLVVEAASQAAVAEFGLLALEAGKDLVVLSVGALVNPALREALVEAARRTGATLHLPSGAVGGLDLLQAAAQAGLDEVTLTTAKPPRAVGMEEIDEETVLFDGWAREAVARFPKNVNVAAAISLAGIGFEATRVRLTADPSLDRNTHTIRAKGAFGEFVLTVRNEPSPQNPATSYLAPMSALALIKKLASPLRIGT